MSEALGSIINIGRKEERDLGREGGTGAGKLKMQIKKKA
jgi:hypothetical protein